jgi:hypothetical protein
MSEDWKVQVSLSSPPAVQYHKGSMANFRGDTVEEVKDLLLAAKTEALLEAASDLEQVWLVVEKLGGSVESAPAQSSSVGDATVTQLRTCAHGKREYKEGWKNGKKWSGYFCPEKAKANQCEVDWVRD